MRVIENERERSDCAANCTIDNEAPVVSIVICTRNRAVQLRNTLATISSLAAASPVSAEVIVVDNGSTDETPLLLAQAQPAFAHVKFKSVLEPRPGKSRALNRALLIAQGAVLLFTDDDVCPPDDWVHRMVAPILEGHADAVAGGIRLAPHLNRPWVTAAHRKWLASTEDLPKESEHPLIGANMAVAKYVFETVRGFDPEVGPGAFGHAEDTLFWLQMREAGFRIVTKLEVEVEHHFLDARLSRESFARQAVSRGEFAAYVEHHWEWHERRFPYVAFVRAAVLLWMKRLCHFPTWLCSEAIPVWDLHALDTFHARRFLLSERRKPRIYDRHGLSRRASIDSERGITVGPTAKC